MEKKPGVPRFSVAARLSATMLCKLQHVAVYEREKLTSLGILSAGFDATSSQFGENVYVKNPAYSVQQQDVSTCNSSSQLPLFPSIDSMHDVQTHIYLPINDPCPVPPKKKPSPTPKIDSPNSLAEEDAYMDKWEAVSLQARLAVESLERFQQSLLNDSIVTAVVASVVDLMHEELLARKDLNPSCEAKPILPVLDEDRSMSLANPLESIPLAEPVPCALEILPSHPLVSHSLQNGFVHVSQTCLFPSGSTSMLPEKMNGHAEHFAVLDGVASENLASRRKSITVPIALQKDIEPVSSSDPRGPVAQSNDHDYYFGAKNGVTRPNSQEEAPRAKRKCAENTSALVRCSLGVQSPRKRRPSSATECRIRKRKHELEVIADRERESASAPVSACSVEKSCAFVFDGVSRGCDVIEQASKTRSHAGVTKNFSSGILLVNRGK